MTDARKLARSLTAWAMAMAALGSAPLATASDWDLAQAAFEDRDDRTGLALVEKAARAGDPRAQLSYGLALFHGERVFPGFHADRAAGRAWMARAVASSPRLLAEAEVPVRKRTRLGLYLSPQDALALKQADPARVLLLDVRTRAEAAYVGMPAAADLLVPYLEHDEFMAEWDESRSTFRPVANARFADDVARALAERGMAREQAELILICRSGDRSAKAADLLAELGFARVYSVVEGFEGDLSSQGARSVNGWKNAGLPWAYRLERSKVQFARR